MTVRPIIFSGGMVAALLAGRKSQTRRLATSPLAKCQPGDLLWVRETWVHYQTIGDRKTADGRSFAEVSDGLAGYRADGFDTIKEFRDHVRLMSDCGLEAVEINGDRWRPSIHMPRWASRLTLEVTEVRQQWLTEISEDDAIAEGIAAISKDGWLVKHGLPDRDGLPGQDNHGWPWDQWQLTPQRAFERLWRPLHGHESWEENPRVVAVTFRVHRQNVDAFLAGRAVA